MSGDRVRFSLAFYPRNLVFSPLCRLNSPAIDQSFSSVVGAKMAATIYVAPRILAFVSLFIVVCSPLHAQPLSNGSILPFWPLVRTGLNFPSPFGCFYRSSKGMPHRPLSSWHKRGYVCIHLPKKDLASIASPRVYGCPSLISEFVCISFDFTPWSPFCSLC